jgi:hypothetical protein
VGLVQEGWVACRASDEVAAAVRRLRAGLDGLVAEVRRRT